MTAEKKLGQGHPSAELWGATKSRGVWGTHMSLGDPQTPPGLEGTQVLYLASCVRKVDQIIALSRLTVFIGGHWLVALFGSAPLLKLGRTICDPSDAKGFACPARSISISIVTIPFLLPCPATWFFASGLYPDASNKTLLENSISCTHFSSGTGMLYRHIIT